MAPFQLRYASEADIPGLSNINIEAFASSGFIPNTFPQATPESLRVFKGVMALKHLANPKMHVLAASDPDSSEVQGYCRWLIPHGIGYDRDVAPLSEHGAAALEDPMRFAPRPMNEEVYNAFKRLLDVKRKQHTTDEDLILDFLASAPAHQGKGIGSAFLRWGLDKADAQKRRTYLEATTEGYPLYCKFGWKAVEEIMIDFSEYGGQGLQKFIIMIRDPQ